MLEKVEKTEKETVNIGTKSNEPFSSNTDRRDDCTFIAGELCL